MPPTDDAAHRSANRLLIQTERRFSSNEAYGHIPDEVHLPIKKALLPDELHRILLKRLPIGFPFLELEKLPANFSQKQVISRSLPPELEKRLKYPNPSAAVPSLFAIKDRLKDYRRGLQF
ncbi:hypothetical protein D3C77_458200 [compost metagenome]